MAAKERLNQLKQQLERLRKDSFSVVANANKIVFQGVQKLADKELKALNDYYKSALASIKSARRGNLKGVAQHQLDLLQDTVNQVISHARESMSIVADTRAELARLVQKSNAGARITPAQLGKVTAPAKKAVAKARAAAKKAGAQAKKTTRKAASAGQKRVASAKKAAAKIVEDLPRPSPTSRAGRATSRAKEAASSAVASISSAVNSAVNAVTDTVNKQG